MKFKPFISQLKSKDFSKFIQLKEQIECTEDLSNCTEYIEKNLTTQEAHESRFSDFAFINRFTPTEQNILKMPSDYRRNLLIQKQIQL